MTLTLTTERHTERQEIKCDYCNSDALYKYGKTRSGKQRFVCLICGRQFTPEAGKAQVQGKPVCDECGKPMHLYKIEGEVVRFRCSGYPKCRTFKKFRILEE